ncbi:MAG: hypothetical protein KJI71_00535 [Patescibacteria group bacterium]|nr:hypothetical protein [Patescibacteria group bacterium]
MPILSVLPDISVWFEDILVFFNQLLGSVLSLGNYLLFAWFLYLFYSLYNGAKHKEQDERYLSHRLKQSRKHGRVGMIACGVIAVLFLTRVLIIVLVSLSSLFPEPFIYDFIFRMDVYLQIVNHEIVSVLLVEKFFVLFLGFISLICFFLFTYGIFLLIYNEKILHKRWKPFKLLIIGLIGLIVIGFTLPFCLMDGISFDIYTLVGWH